MGISEHSRFLLVGDYGLCHDKPSLGIGAVIEGVVSRRQPLVYRPVYNHGFGMGDTPKK